MMREGKELLLELQNLISATNKKGNKMRKMIIRSLTDKEEIRGALVEFIDSSKYHGKHEQLASDLSKIYPVENWSERTLSYMLTNSVNIDFAKVNQILELIEPDEKLQCSIKDLKEMIDEFRLKVSELETALIQSSRTENKIDEKEFDLLSCHGGLLINKINKFLVSTRRVVGQTLL